MIAGVVKNPIGLKIFESECWRCEESHRSYNCRDLARKSLRSTSILKFSRVLKLSRVSAEIVKKPIGLKIVENEFRRREEDH